MYTQTVLAVGHMMCCAFPLCDVSGFMCQLVEYEQQERGSVSVDVRKYEDHRFGDTSVLVCAA
jgi:hypothetical protein